MKMKAPKENLLVRMAVLLIGILVMSGIANAVTMYVDDSNISGPWDGTIQHPYQHIQDGIIHANASDTIFVFAGTYNENVAVDKSVQLLGENKNSTVIDGGNTGNVVTFSADQISIRKFTIRNSGGASYSAGILIHSSHNAVLDNIITGNDYGVYILDSSDSNTISNNTVAGHYGGISILSSSGNLVSKNVLTGDQFWGIYLEFSYNNTVSNNTIANHGHGIYLGSCSENLISRNTIQYNSGGVYLVFSSGNHITKNSVAHNPYGIDLENSSDNTVCGNSVSHSESYGIHLILSSINNNIYHNNLLSNAVNGYDEGTDVWDNGYPSGGNHWDNYMGTDGNSDGIGDTPYLIPGGSNLDRYPLMNTWVLYNCGEVTEDGMIDVADVVFIINYLYKNGPAPQPLCLGDVTGDDIIDVADVVYLINYLYKNGPAPPDNCCGEC